MLKKVKENKKLEIIQKINTFIAFCFANGYNIEELEKEKINIVNKYINNTPDINNLEIYISKNKDYCYLTIHFINKTTRVAMANFRLPNIF